VAKTKELKKRMGQKKEIIIASVLERAVSRERLFLFSALSLTLTLALALTLTLPQEASLSTHLGRWSTRRARSATCRSP